jgi:hypothetical protein
LRRIPAEWEEQGRWPVAAGHGRILATRGAAQTQSWISLLESDASTDAKRTLM